MSSIIENLRVTLPQEGKFATIHNMVDGFYLSEHQMTLIMSVMESEMQLGLSRNPDDRQKSSLQMENTFVHQTINGSEHGDYLALDLGGTNFRVLYVEMREGNVQNTRTHHYQIPNTILKGTGVGLFDYLADCVAKMIHDEGISTANPIPLGFTFSFPMVQSSLNSALLLTWTKKFNCSDTVMRDVVQLLEESIDRRGDINVHVVAILNDAVGTLMTGAYEDHNCAVGLIMGTGCNASYMEYLDRVDKWEGEKKPGLQEIIDIEWGAFGDNGVLDFFKTEYDFQVDHLSNHKGSFTFEKLFAGLYLGELVRIALSALAQEGVLFENTDESLIQWVHEAGTFSTKYVSKIEKDTDLNTANTHAVLHQLGVEQPENDDVTTIRYVCALASNRAAKILTSVLCVLLRHINKREVTIAVDGSLFELHPTIRPQMECMMSYLQPTTRTTFIMVKDGSGVGAAYVAAVADRMEKEGLIDTHHKPDATAVWAIKQGYNPQFITKNFIYVDDLCRAIDTMKLITKDKQREKESVEEITPVVGRGFDLRQNDLN